MTERKRVIGTPHWMAPEVLREQDYDCKVDIWSLGITAIELGDGKPPLADIQPTRAIFMIPINPPPTMLDSSKWSHDFNDFVRVCLTDDPARRPTARELLAHRFIQNAKPKQVLAELIATDPKEQVQLAREREQQRREKQELEQAQSQFEQQRAEFMREKESWQQQQQERAPSG